ncbi:MAG: hypothetical protein CL472_03530 [Acidobacteria bacterium]|nr:hypothetical protein [Acidobacteriota bacterium]|tara:strand:+ start:798 stop:1298 length:501 start_codon:yes stop_codon:yes gene_type:complete
MVADRNAVADARQSITDTLYRYCRAMDRIDHALGYSIWHEDGTADYGRLFQGTGREFIDWVCELHEPLSHHHQIGNILIQVDGDKAGSEAYVTTNLMATQDGRQMLRTGFGRYVDQWSKREGRWAIDHRRYILEYIFTREVEATAGWGLRDRSDPSYAVLGAIGAA